MLIYYERSVINLARTKDIFKKYKNAELLEIGNYKNIFDKKLSGQPQNSIVLASVNNAISKAPPLYGHPWWGYFFKNSLNCVYDCSYCYLKWAFKNEQNVFFLNYEDIKQQITKTIWESKNEVNWFYSSDYSDNLATDSITDFCHEFIPFFALQKHAKMEIRTKSTNIQSMLNLTPTNNVEIAFSLNPAEVIAEHEKLTSSLEKRIHAINTLINAWWQVGIRFIPLIECENYERVYNEFLDYILQNIDIDAIYSVFIGWLLYTHDDYNEILKKQPYLKILHDLEKWNDGYYRESQKMRKFFYMLFQEKLWKNTCNLCLDEI